MIMNICYYRKNTYFIKTNTDFLNENGAPKDGSFPYDEHHLTDRLCSLDPDYPKENGKVVK
jgi:hypothetical protein